MYSLTGNGSTAEQDSLPFLLINLAKCERLLRPLCEACWGSTAPVFLKCICHQ